MTKACTPDEASDWMMKLTALSLPQLLARSEAMTVAGHGTVVTYSRKVFIPLTQLCRDVCHYCTFAKRPSELAAPFLDLEAVLDIARAGEAAGCREALFTLGDQPETRYAVAREWLAARGYASTLDYVAAAAKAVLAQTTLLPHLNPGLTGDEDYAALRPLSASMGLMLESASDRLCAKGMPHYGSPDKVPAARLESIRLAGEAQVPFTTGLLIGIGETRAERVEALIAIRDLHARYGHIQEVIIQNFCAKDATQMAGASEPSLEDHLWTIAAARLILGPDMTIQAPPNLREGSLAQLIRAGVNDWGGVSPVTPDHVNPEAPWPHLEKLETETEAAGRHLRQRLAIGPAFA
ncbi:MAG: 7,8-didemethyl-8-hydroxy-5-deazariboflavin synthase, CofG subunit, partial [Pseudomonadota bacterium]